MKKVMFWRGYNKKNKRFPEITKKENKIRINNTIWQGAILDGSCPWFRFSAMSWMSAEKAAGILLN